MYRIITLCIFFFPFTGLSQTYINKSKAEVKKELTDYIIKNDSLKALIAETDSTIRLVIKGPEVLPADFIYFFDKSGKCKSEKVVTYCDSCYNKFLTVALNRKQYHWKKINENQYVSDYASRMLIELPADKSKDFSFLIIRTDWSKSMYNMLTGK